MTRYICYFRITTPSTPHYSIRQIFKSKYQFNNSYKKHFWKNCYEGSKWHSLEDLDLPNGSTAKEQHFNGHTFYSLQNRLAQLINRDDPNSLISQRLLNYSHFCVTNNCILCLPCDLVLHCGIPHVTYGADSNLAMQSGPAIKTCLHTQTEPITGNPQTLGGVKKNRLSSRIHSNKQPFWYLV